jgi:hypothetical protein
MPGPLIEAAAQAINKARAMIALLTIAALICVLTPRRTSRGGHG